MRMVGRFAWSQHRHGDDVRMHVRATGRRWPSIDLVDVGGVGEKELRTPQMSPLRSSEIEYKDCVLTVVSISHPLPYGRDLTTVRTAARSSSERGKLCPALPTTAKKGNPIGAGAPRRDCADVNSLFFARHTCPAPFSLTVSSRF